MPTEYTWPLTPDPTPAPAAAPEAAAAAVAAQNAAKGLPSFLGQGLLRPFRRDLKNDFASASSVDLVVACVGQILGTKADTPLAPGELPWRTDFGSRLHLIRHKNNNDIATALATVYVQEAVARWEPRVRVLVVVVETTSNPRVKQVRVRFNVVDQGGRTILSDQEATVPIQAAA